MTRGCHGRGAPTRWFRLEQKTSFIKQKTKVSLVLATISSAWAAAEEEILGGEVVFYLIFFWHIIYSALFQGFKLCALNYDFHILDNAFLIHRSACRSNPARADSISEFEDIQCIKYISEFREICTLIDIIFTDLVSKQRRLSTLLLTRKRSPRKILSSRPRSSHRFFLDCNFAFHRIRKSHKLNPILAIISLN